MAYKTPAKRIESILRWLDNHRELQQFGQPNSTKSYLGKTGCSFTVAQCVIGIWTGHIPSHNDIARIVGYPTARQAKHQIGLLSSQVLRLYAHYDLRYKMVRGWDWDKLERRSALYGPVHFYTRYTHQPEWKGFKYAGATADGKPNGYARPYGKAGKTQLSGFDGGHSELLAGYKIFRNKDGSVHHVTDYIRDPNHGSKSRPERPSYDRIYRTQGKKLYESYKSMPGITQTVAFIPEVVFNGR